MRLSLNGTRLRQPISASCCSVNGCVMATYSCTGKIEFRKNPSLEVKAFVASTNDFALTVSSSRKKNVLSALLDADHSRCFVNFGAGVLRRRAGLPDR